MNRPRRGVGPGGPGGADDDPPFVSLGDALDRVVRSLRGVPRTALTGVFDRWDEAVGATVAAHVRPVSLDGHRLLVEVDEPAWATQLRFFEADLLTRLADVAGTGVVRELQVRVRRPGTGRTNP